MPFQTGNQLAKRATKKPAIRKAVNKTQRAFNGAIDLLGKNTVSGCGVTRLSELIAEKLESDVVGTIKGLSALFPKDANRDTKPIIEITINRDDVTITHDNQSLKVESNTQELVSKD